MNVDPNAHHVISLSLNRIPSPHCAHRWSTRLGADKKKKKNVSHFARLSGREMLLVVGLPAVPKAVSYERLLLVVNLVLRVGTTDKQRVRGERAPESAE